MAKPATTKLTLRSGYVLVYLLHGVDEVDVEGFGILGLVLAADSEEYVRGGVVGGGG